MVKFYFSLLSTTLISGIAYADLNCAGRLPSCAEMGYSQDDIADCSSYLYCPFDTSYKVCTDCPADDDDCTGKCKIGDIYFENGTCAGIESAPDLSENPIGVVFMLTDSNGKPVNTTCSNHGKIIAKSPLGKRLPFGACLAAFDGGAYDTLTTMQYKHGEAVPNEYCEDFIKLASIPYNAESFIQFDNDTHYSVHIDGTDASCNYDNILPFAYRQEQCTDFGDGWDMTCEFNGPYYDIYVGECDENHALEELWTYNGAEAAGLKQFCSKHKNKYWYLPSLYELLYLISPNPSQDLVGACPSLSYGFAGKPVQGTTFSKVSQTLLYLDDEGQGAEMETPFWSVTYANPGSMWALESDNQGNVSLKRVSNSTSHLIRPIAAF